ncbi:hypothetical protein EDB83DRAFT_2415164 [Lactarius deliciosus]|nr:hypothetical protein EDB83DRAFT_2415164 [Lactarius deliciosus]
MWAITPSEESAFLSVLSMSFQSGATVETWPTRSSRTSARVPAQPAVFDTTALSVRPSSTLVRLSSSTLSSLHIYTLSAPDIPKWHAGRPACLPARACRHQGIQHVSATQGESWVTDEIRVNVSTSKLALPAQTSRTSSARSSERGWTLLLRSLPAPLLSTKVQVYTQNEKMYWIVSVMVNHWRYREPNRNILHVDI